MKGYLKYRCMTCGALIKESVEDVEAAILVAVRERPKATHQCNESDIGVTNLIGGTFSEDPV